MQTETQAETETETEARDAIAAIGKNSIGQRNPSTLGGGRLAEEPGTLRVLSRDDWDFWRRNGYLVLRGAVAPAAVERIERLIWEFEGMDPHDPSTWHTPEKSALRRTELSYNAGMVELYNHQALWDTRQDPRIHGAFADLWGTDELWVSIDRVNCNLPPEPGFEFRSFMHWDYDPEGGDDSVQGVLAVTDQLDEEVGGFTCIPELFRDFAAWREEQGDDFDWYRPDVRALPKTPVTMRKGDLLIFNSRLCHGIRQNVTGNRVRMAQYIAMLPAREHDPEGRDWRVKCWRERLPPQGYSLHGDPRRLEQTRYETAQLTPLGERLLGLASWRD